MPGSESSEVNYNQVHVWLNRAGANALHCFLCKRIVEANPPSAGSLKTLKISGVEISPEVQIEHLARCVGIVRAEDEPTIRREGP